MKRPLYNSNCRKDDNIKMEFIETASVDVNWIHGVQCRD
jgi:hypothetical protein